MVKRSIIAGMGEIGKALCDVLSNDHDGLAVVDKDGKYHEWWDVWDGCSDGAKEIDPTVDGVDILHICFPYSDQFENEVQRYQDCLNPDYTVVHSTVPVGTSRKLGAIHSPVIGRHPHLTESIKTMTKFLGGKRASEVGDYFRRSGINIYLTDKQESTELLKILCTTTFGVLVEMTKETKRQCDKHGVPFELWTIWTQEYNQGYARLGMPYVQRPSLVPIMTRISGHCVCQNAELLDSWMTQLIKDQNG
jgi:hypothetical protein